MRMRGTKKKEKGEEGKGQRVKGKTMIVKANPRLERFPFKSPLLISFYALPLCPHYPFPFEVLLCQTK